MTFEAELRRIVREEVRAALAEAGIGMAKRGPTPAPQPSPAADRSQSQWEDLSELEIRSGSRTYRAKKGGPCRVVGLGRGGSVGSGWTIVRIQRHRENGKINVEVTKGRGGHSRIVSPDKIVYVRPK